MLKKLMTKKVGAVLFVLAITILPCGQAPDDYAINSDGSVTLDYPSQVCFDEHPGNIFQVLSPKCYPK